MPDSSPDTPEAIHFRKSFAREVRVKFIGVWDTVGALGIPNWTKRKRGRNDSFERF
ncbi:MAG: phospholipase effector Tle1 domain-containing protein [bacterium]